MSTAERTAIHEIKITGPGLLLLLVLAWALATRAGLLEFVFPDSYGSLWMPPGEEHLLGTAGSGLDYGYALGSATASSFFSALFGAGVAVLLGVALGVGRGYASGSVQGAARFVSAALGILPVVFVALIFAALHPNYEPWQMMLIFGVLTSPRVSDLVRLRVLEIKRMEYIDAARALGLAEFVILGRHILLRGLSGLIAMAFCHALRDALLLDVVIGVLKLDVAHVLSLGQIMQGILFESPVMADPEFTVVHWATFLVVLMTLLMSLTVMSRELGRRAQFGGGEHGE